MATELRPLFATLEDNSTGAGAGLSLKAEGAASASGGTNYAGILVGKDPSGNLQFLSLNSNNEVIVDSESAEIACVSAEGTVDDGSASLVVLATIVIQATMVYRDIEVWVSCYRDTKYLIETVDDVGVTDVITQLAVLRTGSGDFSKCCIMKCRKFTSGSTGIQNLRIRAINQNSLSDIDGMIAAIEEQ